MILGMLRDSCTLSTQYLDIDDLHDFAITILRSCRDVYARRLFPHGAWVVLMHSESTIRIVARPEAKRSWSFPYYIKALW